MTTEEIFQDQKHIEQIRKRLWRGREYGQAAVMVGAGFSRNADRASPETPSFPTWSKLAELMYRELNPNASLTERQLKKITQGQEALKLASSYEETFGRAALDDFLLESIPDMKYIPGHLHELLLNLRWSDVFTTNYDTLLERTLTSIHDRKYDIICAPADIPHRMKPRIIKLHGSFPCQRPFIFTEEDYKKYPTNFAPFVNMAQQAIMENVFCLIGFSSDDPNFKHWIDWVYKNLGDHIPAIYLCGLFNFTDSYKQTLKQQKITTIDLSPLFPESKWPDLNERHAKALEWFLLTLMEGAPPNHLNWPKPTKRSIWKKSDDRIPDIPEGPAPFTDLGDLRPQQESLEIDSLRKLHRRWSKKRQEYPGWIIAPKDNRDELWQYTENWVEPVLKSIENLSPPENILLLCELNWRLETALVPLFTSWVEKIADVVKSFNPFPHLVEIDNATIRPDISEYREFAWDSIVQCWVQLIFALIRSAREDQDESQFRYWMDILEKVTKQKLEWQSRWFYEECLFHLFRLDQDKIRKTLEIWPSRPELPFWDVKRASILTELGEPKEAEKIIEKALNRIRTRQDPFSNNFLEFSQEGWTMVLLKAIKDNRLGTKKDYVEYYRDRWDKLGNYKCNPWIELEMLVPILKGPSPSLTFEGKIKKKFDPGKEEITHQLFAGYNITPYFPAFAFLRIFEEGALPIRCGSVSMFSDSVVNSAKWIEPFAPLWSLSSIIRTGETKKLEETFSRISIATMNQDKINHLYRLINSLIQVIKDLVRNPQQLDQFFLTTFSGRQVTFLSELISRLCFRFSHEQQKNLLKLTMDIYNLPIFREYHFLHECVDMFFRRLLFAMPQSEILQNIPALLSLPIPTESGFEVSLLQDWREPFEHIHWLENTRLSQDFDRSAWSKPIENLMRILEEGTPEARKRTSLRIEKLYDINALTDQETEAFGKALWCRLDPQKNLPVDTGFYNFAFLSLPEVEDGIAKKNLQEYILSTDFPRFMKRMKASNGRPGGVVSFSLGYNGWYVKEWLGATIPLYPIDELETKKFIDWTSEEVIQLLKKIEILWDDEKTELREVDSSGPFSKDEILRQQYSDIIKLMAQVVLPRIGKSENKTKSIALRLLNEMNHAGICILSALPMTLVIDPSAFDEVTQKLRFGINSSINDEVRNSISGYLNWLALSKKNSIPAPPNDLADKLVNKVLTRGRPGLLSAINYTSLIIDKFPTTFNEIQLELLLIGLEYLIEETELSVKLDPYKINETHETIPVNVRPTYRQLAGRVAHSLFRLLSDEKKEIPQILLKWEDICKIDPLPEVRREWY